MRPCSSPWIRYAGLKVGTGTSLGCVPVGLRMRLHHQAIAALLEPNVAVAVGPVDGRAGGAEGLQGGRDRVPVRVVRADLDRREPRPEALEDGAEPFVSAAV